MLLFLLAAQKQEQRQRCRERVAVGDVEEAGADEEESLLSPECASKRKVAVDVELLPLAERAALALRRFSSADPPQQEDCCHHHLLLRLSPQKKASLPLHESEEDPEAG
jgi:hypothetical protein